MTRWLWLLAVPYVVQISTNPPCPTADDCQKILNGCKHGDYYTCGCFSDADCGKTFHVLQIDKRHPGEGGFKLECEGSADDCNWIYDAAFLLNEAHERRTNPPLGEWRNPHCDPPDVQIDGRCLHPD